MLYADFNATTPIPTRVLNKMLPFLGEEYGNPSSTGNRLGAKAKSAVDLARVQVAELLGADPSEVVFTSGGTESCAHALLGCLAALAAGQPNRNGAPAGSVAYSAVEHSAVIEAAHFAVLTGLGSAAEIGVDEDGGLKLEQLLDHCRARKELQAPAIVSLMTANNETGALFDIFELSHELKKLGAIIHSDAVQAVGKCPLNFAASGLDFLSISAHKFGGPKGCGALVIRKNTPWHPVVKGGGQESGRRGGTEAVAMLVGMGEAAQLHTEQLAQGLHEELAARRDAFEERLLNAVPRSTINAQRSKRLANTSSVCFEGINGQELVGALAAREVIVSAGSACASTGHKPSRVLTSMGMSALHCLSTVRISFGMETTQAEIDSLQTIIAEEVARLRAQSAQELAAMLGPR